MFDVGTASERMEYNLDIVPAVPQDLYVAGIFEQCRSTFESEASD